MKNSGKNVKNRILSLFMCLVCILSMACVFPAYADQTSALRDDLNDINSEIDQKAKELKEGKAKSSALSNEIKQLEKKIYAAESELVNLQIRINDTKSAIEEALIDLDRRETEMAKQNDELSTRLRTMYKNGEVSMLTVLLNSGSMSDFLTNLEMAKRIYGADADVLSSMQSGYKEVMAEKEKLANLKQQLLDQQEEEKTRKSTLSSDKNVVSSKKKEVDADNKELSAQIDALNAEANALTAEILKLQGGGAYIGGTMLWPSQSSKRVTSLFGNRMHPILKVYKMHTGIDIGAAAGTNILAANAGTVISAGYNSGYGYMVMIDHGGGIVTLYAHSSKLLVSKGDIVKRGDVIALVGSTGMSTGPHLHFEVRLNGAYQNPLNYVSNK